MQNLSIKCSKQNFRKNQENWLLKLEPVHEYMWFLHSIKMQKLKCGVYNITLQGMYTCVYTGLYIKDTVSYTPRSYKCSSAWMHACNHAKSKVGLRQREMYVLHF